MHILQAETQTQQRATEQERQTAPLRETMEAEQPGVLPTVEQAETRQRAARAETETERTGILAGVDEDTIAKVQRIANIVAKRLVLLLTEDGQRPDALLLTRERYSSHENVSYTKSGHVPP